MRHYLNIDLGTRAVERQEMSGESIARGGRYFIAKTLNESDAARVDPLAAGNPLVFSAGPFAGTNFSNANRTSIGCRSPLTGGIKEANAGGTLGFALGQLHLCGFTLQGSSDEWVVIHIARDGAVSFDPAGEYLGRGNFEAAALLHEKYGRKVSVVLCGPVGEYQGLLAGIAVSDTDLRPSRLAARGGVGAVMGSKKVKAVVVDLDRMPQLHDRRKVMDSVKTYRTRLLEQEVVLNMKNLGTAFMADVQNEMGGLPVRNFSAGRLVDSASEPLKMGGQFIREQNLARGGIQSHACMPGCVIECSNVYADSDGNEVVSPVEYETLGLMGTNCGLTDPDDLARMNFLANDLGVDTIETGAMMAVLMEAGLAAFGDVSFMTEVFDEIRRGTEKGRLYAQGTARVGEHLGVARVPVIKKQAISAYDPRVVEVTGITMMTTAQGADHTAGNVPTLDCTGKSTEELTDASIEAQITTAASDSLGLCIFGRSVTNTNAEFIVNAINAAHGTNLRPEFFTRLGRETLALELAFNRAVGFTEEDDELPAFFYDEPLAPTNKAARHHSRDVRRHLERSLAE